MKFNPIVKTDPKLIFEFENVIPDWMQKSGVDQFKNFGFEYNHHGASEDDGEPYFGKLLYLKQTQTNLAKPHIIMNLLDVIKYDLINKIDKEAKYVDLQRIAVNGQLPNQSPAKHLDTSNDQDLWTAIYYLNDSDGDTVFYHSLKNEQEEVYRSKFKQGKVTLFHGLFLHQALAPQSDWRITIGISFFMDTKLNNMLSLDLQ